MLDALEILLDALLIVCLIAVLVLRRPWRKVADPDGRAE